MSMRASDKLLPAPKLDKLRKMFQQYPLDMPFDSAVREVRSCPNRLAVQTWLTNQE